MPAIPSLLAVLAAATLALGACASSSGAAAGASAASGPEAHGERLYREHCGACHRLRDPGEQTRDRWAWAVEKYGPRAHLSPEDRPRVLAYLQAHAKDAAPAPGSR